MKRTIFFVFALTLATTALAVTPPHKTDYVPTTTATPANCVEIPSDFAKPELYNRSLLDALKGKPVKRVELWYTRYKKSPSFDQKALNDKRVRQLQAAFPELKDPNIEWVWKEQTAAVTEEDAGKCFHGFRLFTESEAPLWTNEFRIADASNPGEKIQVDNSKGLDFQAKSGTVVHIPANAVADAEGKPVKGNYTVTYTEYRDPAQIAFSGLPMTLSEGGHPFMMNSAGMYELRGTQNGNPLQLTEPITVDFNCTAQLKDLNFYSLDQQTGTWIKEEPLTFENTAEAKKPEQVLPLEVGKDSPVITSTAIYALDSVPKVAELVINSVVEGDNMISMLSDNAWKNYLTWKKDSSQVVAKLILKEDSKERKLTYKKINAERVANRAFNRGFVVLPIVNGNWEAKNNTGSTLLGENMNAGHTYPNLVRGLNSPKFGVYNCDQQFRMGQTVSVSPNYVDKKSGEVIEQPFVTCIIDKKINGSFSYDPKQISISKSSPSEIILFTKDNKVYHLPASSVEAMQKGVVLEKLEMKDITTEVKTSEDLKAYLKL